MLPAVQRESQDRAVKIPIAKLNLTGLQWSYLQLDH